MNIVRMQSLLEKYGDNQLQQEAMQPTGQVPQFLVIMEIKRRKDLRDAYGKEIGQQDTTTVAEDIVSGGEEPSAQPPLNSSSPPMAAGLMAGMPQQMPAAGTPPPTQFMNEGGPIKAQRGGVLSHREWQYQNPGRLSSEYWGEYIKGLKDRSKRRDVPPDVQPDSSLYQPDPSSLYEKFSTSVGEGIDKVSEPRSLNRSGLFPAFITDYGEDYTSSSSGPVQDILMATQGQLAKQAAKGTPYQPSVGRDIEKEEEEFLKLYAQGQGAPKSRYDVTREIKLREQEKQRAQDIASKIVESGRPFDKYGTPLSDQADAIAYQEALAQLSKKYSESGGPPQGYGGPPSAEAITKMEIENAAEDSAKQADLISRSDSTKVGTNLFRQVDNSANSPVANVKLGVEPSGDGSGGELMSGLLSAQNFPEGAAPPPLTLLEQYKELMGDYEEANKDQRIANMLMNAGAAMMSTKSPDFMTAAGEGLTGALTADEKEQARISQQQKDMMGLIAKQADLDIASRGATVQEEKLGLEEKRLSHLKQRWKDEFGLEGSKFKEEKAKNIVAENLAKARIGLLEEQTKDVGTPAGRARELRDIKAAMKGPQFLELGLITKDGEVTKSGIEWIYDNFQKASALPSLKPRDRAAVLNAYTELAEKTFVAPKEMRDSEDNWYAIELNTKTGKPKQGKKVTKDESVRSLNKFKSNWAQWRTKQDIKTTTGEKEITVVTREQLNN